MARKQHKTAMCQICKKRKTLGDVLPGALVRDTIVEIILKKHPDWSPDGFICLDDLNYFKTEYVHSILEANKGELSALEEEVMRSLKEEEVLSKNINTEFEEQLTFGDRMADKLADFGGSWRFLAIFVVVLLLWVAINSVVFL